MAQQFVNAGLSATPSSQILYSCPSGATAIVIGGVAANVDGNNTATVSIWWTRDGVDIYLIKGGTVAAGSSKGFVDGKLVLMSGNTISVSASATGDIDVTISILEMQ